MVQIGKVNKSVKDDDAKSLGKVAKIKVTDILRLSKMINPNRIQSKQI